MGNTVRVSVLAVLAALGAVLIPAPATAIDLDQLHVYGYIDLEYKQTTADKFDRSGPDDANMKNGSFDQRHFNILADFEVVPALIVKSHVEFEHGINPGVGDASVVLEYGFVEYVAREWLKARGGKMITPYGQFNEIHDATPAFLTVTPPDTLYRSEDYGGFTFIPKWITGAAAFGNIPVLQHHHDIDYIVYIGNGESRSTVNENEHDDNESKALGGRLQFTTHDESFHAGVSAYYGDRAISRARMAERHFTATAHANASFDAFTVRGEAAYSELGDWRETAWYLELSYRIGRLTPYVRYETLDPDTSVSSDGWTIMLAGVNVRALDILFLKFEWNQHDRGPANSDIITGEKDDYGEFRAALAVLF